MQRPFEEHCCFTTWCWELVRIRILVQKKKNVVPKILTERILKTYRWVKEVLNHLDFSAQLVWKATCWSSVSKETLQKYSQCWNHWENEDILGAVGRQEGEERHSPERKTETFSKWHTEQFLPKVHWWNCHMLNCAKKMVTHHLSQCQRY